MELRLFKDLYGCKSVYFYELALFSKAYALLLTSFLSRYLSILI
ncbi:hypothetical protein BA6E_125497 [Bacteroidales bacterium 6E]|nr:hypothetical protein BA6E_125497 [Bacteroidales bacterium 6E]